MAASPVNGDRSPPTLRRSSTNIAAPLQSSSTFHERVALSQEDAGADILYTHPSVRIYHFQPPTDALATLDKSKKTLPDADYPIDAIEILPWRSWTETLSAKGKLIVEKVQGSVHFLKCGSVIHTIMRNSQCWCVDGESKFVMRIGRLRYQRIEMPTTEPQDRERVQEFKEVISKILRFEKTPCPFIRAFQVDLPEDAITPRRRGTWKRREGSTPTIAEEELPFERRSKTARTMSMRVPPPSSFPSRSMTQINMDRPRTASTPSSHGRFSFPDIRSDSPTTYTSGEDGTDSDRPDSASEQAESSHNSEAEESDREKNKVPIIKSPLKNVEVMSPISDESSLPQHVSTRFKLSQKDNRPSVATRVQTFNEYSLQAREFFQLERRSSLPVKELSELGPSPRSTFTNLAEMKIIENKAETHEAEHSRGPLIQPDRLERFQTDFSEARSSDLSLQPQTPAEEKDTTIEELIIVPNSETSPEEDAQDQDTTDTDSLYERLKAEVQREVEVVEADRRRSNALLVFDQESTNTVTKPQPSDSVVEISEADPTDLKPVKERVAVEDLLRTPSNDDVVSNISTDSFHTMLSDEDLQNLTSPRGTVGKRPFSHRREISEVTVTADSMKDMHIEGIEEEDDEEGTILPVTPARQQSIEDDDDDTLWPRRRTPGAFEDETEIRQRLRHRRSLETLPSSPSAIESSLRRQAGDGVPAALIQKAANLALVKPLEVVILLVHVFGRIAQGATVNDLLSGDLFRRPGVRRTASGTLERGIHSRNTTGESEDEDDYAMPLRRKSSLSQHQTEASSLKKYDDDAASFASID